jgi:hypothetical protein
MMRQVVARCDSAANQRRALEWGDDREGTDDVTEPAEPQRAVEELHRSGL